MRSHEIRNRLDEFLFDPTRAFLLTFRSFYTVCFLLVLLGCQPEGAVPAPLAGAHQITQGGSSIDLQGQWQSTCADATELGLGERSTLSYDGLTMIRAIEIAPHGDCASPYIESKISGQYIVGRELAPSISAIDIEVTSAKIKPLNAQGARILSLAKACGTRNWAEGETRDVTDQLGREGCLRRYPKQMFTIFSIEGNKSFFGDGESPSAPQKRPMALEKQLFFTKQ
jgi:hypothetical protein